MLCNNDVLWIHKIYLLKLFEYSDLPAICKIHNVIINKNYTLEGASQVALVVKKPPANAEDIRDMGLIPGLGRSPAGGHGKPLQNSCLENPNGQRILEGYSP